jgi:plasmid stability protein
MTNLTIPVDEEVLKKARLRALMQGTSVSAVLRDFLEAYAGMRGEQDEALQALLSLSGAASARRGERRWTRDELHERSA